MTDNIVFVYSKKGKVTARMACNIQKLVHESLIKLGWKHTATLDPIMLIELLANSKSDKDIIKIVRNLSVIN